MSNSTDQDSVLTVTKRKAKFSPPGYEIVLTEKESQALNEMMQMPGFAVHQHVVVFQRKDHIARKALASADTTEQLQYYKGMAAELQLLVVTLKKIKTQYQKQTDAELDNGLDGVETEKDYK